MEQQYNNGWVGFTKKDWFDMYDTNTAQYPVWCEVFSGLGFKPEETLRANGIDPNAVPIVFKDHWKVGPILRKIEQAIPLTYVDIPDN